STGGQRAVRSAARPPRDADGLPSSNPGQSAPAPSGGVGRPRLGRVPGPALAAPAAAYAASASAADWPLQSWENTEPTWLDNRSVLPTAPRQSRQMLCADGHVSRATRC